MDNSRWRLESGESPIEGLQREVREETDYLVEIGRLIGVYSKPAQDDLVLFLEASITGYDGWSPDEEIVAVGSFGHDELPKPMTARPFRRIMDAFSSATGLLHVFDE